MASRIKGITVEIVGDTTKLQTALKNVNSNIKTTQSELKDVEKLLNINVLLMGDIYVDTFRGVPIYQVISLL